MNLLPSMNILSFFDWMDRNANFNIIQEYTIEELFLNNDYYNEAIKIISQYLHYEHSKTYNETDKYQQVLSYLMSEIKNIVLSNHNNTSSPFAYCSRNRDNDGKDNHIQDIREALDELEKREWNMSSYDASFSFTDPHVFLSGIRSNFNYQADGCSLIDFYLSSKRGSSVSILQNFVDWFNMHYNFKVNFSQIPEKILCQNIDHFLEDYYRHNNRITYAEQYSIGKIIRRTIEDNKDIPYFERLIERYGKRTATFKCLFLSDDDNSFYDLVLHRWEFLHKYSADHLDIFYHPDDLKRLMGYSVADKLNIRSRVHSFPCLYLWTTTLNQGNTIGVADLKEDDLLSLVKCLVDEIVHGKSLQEVTDAGNAFVQAFRERICRNEIIAMDVLKKLFHSCIQLQSNPAIFGDASERQKNTQIRDLMRNMFNSEMIIAGRTFSVQIDDETLMGLSAAAFSAGELDLLIRLDSMPYMIIEALNIKSSIFGIFTSSDKLYEHIRRFTNYDTSGLERNVLLVYTNTYRLDMFYENLISSISNNDKATIKGSQLSGFVNIYSDFRFPVNYANIRVARGRYCCNGIERYLYVFVIQMAQRKREPQKKDADMIASGFTINKSGILEED